MKRPGNWDRRAWAASLAFALAVLLTASYPSSLAGTAGLLFGLGLYTVAMAGVLHGIIWVLGGIVGRIQSLTQKAK